MKRRALLKAGGVAAVAVAPLPLLFDRRDEGGAALVADRERVLDLRKGLSYRVVQRVFDPMSDGLRVPARPDGMACFAGPGGSWVLMRNHELDHTPHLGAFRRGQPAEAYDQRAYGGVTRVVVDPASLRPKTSNLVLTGTLRNCSGGVSPWGWLTCEEANDAGHGYVFLCDVYAVRVNPPRKIVGYGRYRHEAVAIDPVTSIAYLTEDQGDSCLYRFVPHDPRAPFAGKLQALKHVGVERTVVSAQMSALKRFAVEWVDVPENDPADDTVRVQAQERGAALISRGEGIWYHDDALYIASTDGGRAHRGQILRLALGRGKRPDRLELIAESPSESVLDMPDNLTVAPWGDVIVAEDGGGAQLIRGITPTGQVYDIARNARSGGEFAGVCFSPDGSTLFLNMQTDGLTIAITGIGPDLRTA